jgi:hypothetical protein
MGFVLGLNCKAYRNTGTYVTPVWDLVDNIKDLTLNLDKSETDITTRASSGWVERAGVLKDASVDFEMVWDPADTDFTALLASYTANTGVGMLFLDGLIATVGSQGLRATMEVFKFSRNEQLTEAVKASVTMKPQRATNPPAWYTVAS